MLLVFAAFALLTCAAEAFGILVKWSRDEVPRTQNSPFIRNWPGASRSEAYILPYGFLVNRNCRDHPFRDTLGIRIDDCVF
jgi:hypothetical protein